MIDPKPEDVGRGVVYRDSFTRAPMPGVITSFNEHSVFVRYQGQFVAATGQATLREDLEWLLPREGE